MFIAYHPFFNYETRLMVIDTMTAKTQDVYQPSITNGIAGKELLGRWVINNKYWGRNIEIYKENGQIYLFNKFHSDGSEGTQKLIKSTNGNGKTIYKVPDSDTGDHYLITGNGLQIRDSLGLIDTARTVK